MLTLKNEYISLRALEPEDLEFIHTIENDETIWALSNTITPYSRYVIKNYLENAFKDIFETKQLRLAITLPKGKTIGLIDVFDFDFKNHRAGIGIVLKKQFQKQGFANYALQLLIKYCFTHLQLHQLYCNITEDNNSSIALFKKQGFKLVGLKKDWTFVNGSYKNEYLFQLINNHVH